MKPQLIYDGECGFCRYTVRYAERLTGDRVAYRPFQAAAEEYPHIPLAEFQRAVQLILPGGGHASGAEASFGALSYAPGHGLWLWLYRHLPGFAWLAERAYTFVSRRREFFHRLAALLYGRDYAPPQWRLASWVFIRLLALVYLGAFLSFGLQAHGLIGANGISPLGDFLDFVADRHAGHALWKLPTLFWIDSGNVALTVACASGVALAVLALLGVFTRACLIGLFALYLSLVTGGQVFTSFQWDMLLCEAGFLAIFLGRGQRLVVWLYRWLLFRFMFMAGCVKLLSGDPNWWNLSALQYHYYTQLLPSPLAWYAHHLPDTVHRLSAGAMFFIELVLPFFIFMPRRLRFAAAFGFLLLQASIALTGNYNFFNLLTMTLCLFLFDDAALRRLVPRSLHQFLDQEPPAGRSHPAARAGFAVLALVSVLVGGLHLVRMFAPGAVPPAVYRAVQPVTALRIVNGYGPFAVMTTERIEIVIEGSNDRAHWFPYRFPYKPGDPARAPQWMIPHQPRLDWQMWFAALGNAQNTPWFGALVIRLLQGEQDVLALLEVNPFPAAPPRYLRARRYAYRFTTPRERAETGRWWAREPRGLYLPVTYIRRE